MFRAVAWRLSTYCTRVKHMYQVTVMLRVMHLFKFGPKQCPLEWLIFKLLRYFAGKGRGFISPKTYLCRLMPSLKFTADLIFPLPFTVTPIVTAHLCKKRNRENPARFGE